MLASKKISAYCFICVIGLLCFSLGMTNPVSSGQQGLFGTKTTDDGAITICSDSLNYNQKINELTYSGNVLVVQIKHANILCHKVEEASAEHVNQSERIVSLWIEAKDKTYIQIQKEELVKAKQLCLEERACKVLFGQKLKVFFDQKNQVEKVMMMADKSGENIAKFYGLAVDEKNNKSNDNKNYTKKKPNETLAQGKTMKFLPAKQEMIISDKAKIVKDGNIFTGKNIIYNTKTKIVTVPNDGQRATMIINSDGTLSSGGQ